MDNGWIMGNFGEQNFQFTVSTQTAPGKTGGCNTQCLSDASQLWAIGDNFNSENFMEHREEKQLSEGTTNE